MKNKQECIPVGCVPPTAVAVWGGLHQVPPGPDTPLEQAPPRAGTPRDQTPPRTRHPPVDRHTPVNILPYPKLRAAKTTITNYVVKFVGPIICADSLFINTTVLLRTVRKFVGILS